MNFEEWWLENMDKWGQCSALDLTHRAYKAGYNDALRRAAEVCRDIQRCTCPTEQNVVRGRDKPHEAYCPWEICNAIDRESVTTDPPISPATPQSET
jgi:hypothetical protein